MPISLDHLIAFALASFVVLVIPGPTIIMIVSQALAHGKRVAVASVLGVGLGDLVAASLSLAGVGALMAASATGFAVVKTLGALYLLYIAVKMWRAPLPVMEAATVEARGRFSIFRDSFLVTVFNPKGLIFFTAFVPQFIVADHAFLPQATLLVAVFVGLGILNAAIYLHLADRARHAIARPKVLKAVTRAGAGILAAAGLASLFARRPV
jgi:threonine/homoserine/homoserine lactone efflux protein